MNLEYKERLRVRRLVSRPGAAAFVAIAVLLSACGGEEGEDAEESQADSDPSADTSPSGNTAPTIDGDPPSQVMVGRTLDFTPQAEDADDDSLSFEIKNGPEWADFDTTAGRLHGTPDEGDQGTYAQIRIVVSDGEDSAELGPFAIDVVSSASGAATLSWTPPDSRTDGTPVQVESYHVYAGTASGDYDQVASVDAGVVTYTVDSLTPATWYFAVTAVDADGLESGYSNEASKEIL